MEHEHQGRIEDVSQDKKIVAIDSQILNNMEQCYYKWYLYNICNWRPKRKSKSFDKGWLVHEILRAYYQALMNKEDWNHAVKAAMEHGHKSIPETGLPITEIQECIKAANEYFEFYRGDMWEPLAIEETFSYKMYEDDELIILYEGIVDLRVKTNELENLPVDHKTTSKNDPIHQLNNQFIGYCRAHQVSRMVINRIGFQKTLPPAEKYTRHLKSYDKDNQEEWAEEVVHTVKMGLLHHDMGIYPRNFTSCDGKYGPCFFTDVCSIPKDGRDWKLRVEYERVEEGWDPLKRD